MALAVLTEWCVEWSVKANVDQCGTMHMRKKGVKRSGQKFVMNGEVVQYISVEVRFKGGHLLSGWKQWWIRCCFMCRGMGVL